jgi:hypothetical protein
LPKVGAVREPPYKILPSSSPPEREIGRAQTSACIFCVVSADSFAKSFTVCVFYTMGTRGSDYWTMRRVVLYDTGSGHIRSPDAFRIVLITGEEASWDKCLLLCTAK